MNPWTWPPSGVTPKTIIPPPLPGAVLQRVRTQDVAAFSFTGTIPLDNTIPQSSEGIAYPALDTTITPSNALSKLSIEVLLSVSAAAVTGVNVALFRDAGTDAIATGFTSIESANRVRAMVFAVTVPAGSIAPTTFKLRAGAGGANGFINSNGATPLFGGTFIACMTVTEIAA